jgi:signal transduction histidine kinase
MNEVEKNKYSDRVSQMLSRAHAMAENFLQISRAEMSNAKQFQEVDFVSLVLQVLDDAYVTAKQKNIKFQTSCSQDIIWIKADFGLLQRAVANVLLNAVKYSPENAMITVNLSEADFK